MDITYHATFGSNRPSEGFPQKRGNITLLWVFCYPVLFSRSCTKVEPMHRFLCWMAQVTFPPKDGPFGGQDNEWHHMGKICPKNSPKRGVHRQFQAKMPKFINRNVSGTINPTNKQLILRTEFRPGTSWVIRHYSKPNTTWLAAATLKNDMTSYFGSRCSNLDEIRQPDTE